MLAFFNLSLLSNLTNPNKDTGMTKINSPPSLVDAMCGVDSLHIQMECSPYEMTLFLREMKMKHKIIKKTKYTTEIEIILAGEKITAVSTAQRRTTLEFGGLYYSRNSKVKLHFIRKIIRKFKDWKVKRLDFACDIKADFGSVAIKTPDKYSIFRKTDWEGFYFNKTPKSAKKEKKTLSYYCYNRSKRIRLFSFPLARIEVRIFKDAINNRNLGLCLQEDTSLSKCASLIEKLFENLHISVGATRVRVKVDAQKTLENFVEFLESDNELPYGKDLFNVQRSLGMRDHLEAWMKAKKITWKDFPQACKKKKALICKEVGISHPTFRKAIHFATKNF